MLKKYIKELVCHYIPNQDIGYFDSKIVKICEYSNFLMLIFKP